MSTIIISILFKRKRIPLELSEVLLAWYSHMYVHFIAFVCDFHKVNGVAEKSDSERAAEKN